MILSFEISEEKILQNWEKILYALRSGDSSKLSSEPASIDLFIKQALSDQGE